MPRLTITNSHGFTPDDLRKWEKKQTNVNFRIRITAVRLIMEGWTGKDVTQMCNLHRQSVSTYVKTFNESGLHTLLHRKSGSGRPTFLTDTQREELKQVLLTTSPSDHGLGWAVSWTTPMIRQYLKQTYQIEMSLTGILRMLWRLQLSYTRPTYVLKKADPKKQKVFQLQMATIKKTSR